MPCTQLLEELSDLRCIVRSKAWSSFAMVTSRVPSEASGEGAEGESAD